MSNTETRVSISNIEIGLIPTFILPIPTLALTILMVILFTSISSSLIWLLDFLLIHLCLSRFYEQLIRLMMSQIRNVSAAYTEITDIFISSANYKSPADKSESVCVWNYY